MRWAWASLTVTALAVSCARTLPDQDRRIVSAGADAKLSADLLWKEFQASVPAATRKYHGRVVIVSGVVTADAMPPPNSVDGTSVAPVAAGSDADATAAQMRLGPSVLFAEAGGRGIVGYLLVDQAQAITKTAAPGQRLTLKCFCEGFNMNVILKSCVKP